MMRNWLTLLTFLAVGTVACAQSTTVTVARVPERPDLDRLALRMGWNISLPLDSQRDGIITVQLIVIPDPVRKDAETAILVVQTRSGSINVFDAETGRRVWSRRPAPAYPAFIPEVGYDPHGALLVIRDQNLYRFDIFPTAAKTEMTLRGDENEGKLVTLPEFPTTSAVSVIADPTKNDEGLIVVCFSGNKLVAYGRNQELWRYHAETAPIEWKRPAPYSDDSKFKPGDNPSPSLTAVASIFGPDFGTKDKAKDQGPPAPSLTLIQDLAHPNIVPTNIQSSPSLTPVNRLTEVADLSRRDYRLSPIENTSRNGDVVNFRIRQAPRVIRIPVLNTRGETSYATKLIMVGTQHDIQIDVATEKRGLSSNIRIGGDVIRSDISGDAAFRHHSAFVPTQDGTIYAFDSEFGFVTWITSLQVLPVGRPAVVDSDLFITSREGKLFRLKADDGTMPVEGSFARDGSFPGLTAKQFLAASERYAYALDRNSNVVVLDRKRGTIQGRVSVPGFTTAYVNDVTDRIILGSDDGRLICLHDVASPTQKLYRTNALPKAPPRAEAPAAEGMPEKPAEKAGEKPADKPAEKPADKPADKAAEKAADKPAEKPAEKPADAAGEKPAAKPAGKEADKPATKPADKPADKTPAKPADPGK